MTTPVSPTPPVEGSPPAGALPPPKPVVSPTAVLVGMGAVAVIGLAAAFVILLRGGPTASSQALEIAKYLGTPLAFGWALYQSVKNANAIHSVHVDVNSRLSQLVKATDAAARSEGRAEGLASAQPDPVVTITDPVVTITPGKTTAAKASANSQDAASTEVPSTGEKAP